MICNCILWLFRFGIVYRFSVHMKCCKIECLSGICIELVVFFKQEKPVVFSYRLSLRFGTDLLSHVLPQYHWLWWA
jgi:hypothetical protein